MLCVRLFTPPWFVMQLELAYINTSHPDFIGGSRAIAEVMERNRTPNGGSSGTEVRPVPVVEQSKVAAVDPTKESRSTLHTDHSLIQLAPPLVFLDFEDSPCFRNSVVCDSPHDLSAGKRSGLIVLTACWTGCISRYLRSSCINLYPCCIFFCFVRGWKNPENEQP